MKHRLASSPIGALLCVTFFALSTTASAQEAPPPAPTSDEGPSLVDDLSDDMQTGCAALDTFGSVKGEAEGGPELNWAAWGCWVGGVAGLMLTPFGVPLGAALGAAFGLVVGGFVDKTDVMAATVWAIPGVAVGLLTTVGGLAAVIGLAYAQGAFAGNSIQAEAIAIGATVISFVVMASALVSGPLAMGGLAHGLHRRSTTTSTRHALREVPPSLALADQPMQE